MTEYLAETYIPGTPPLPAPPRAGVARAAGQVSRLHHPPGQRHPAISHSPRGRPGHGYRRCPFRRAVPAVPGATTTIQPRPRRHIMHPMFKELFIDTDTDYLAAEDDRRRRARRSRRARPSSTGAPTTTPPAITRLGVNCPGRGLVTVQN